MTSPELPDRHCCHLFHCKLKPHLSQPNACLADHGPFLSMGRDCLVTLAHTNTPSLCFEKREINQAERQDSTQRARTRAPLACKDDNRSTHPFSIVRSRVERPFAKVYIRSFEESLSEIWQAISATYHTNHENDSSTKRVISRLTLQITSMTRMI
jgi:hypothetical protein